MMYGWHYGDGSWGWLFSLLVLALIIVGIIVLVRALARGDYGGERRDEALDVLKKRYASGEITKKEFEEKRKDLRAGL